MTSLGERSVTLVIRIWREARPNPAASVVWRGSVESVGSEEKAYFTNLADLMAFVGTRMRQIGIDIEE